MKGVLKIGYQLRHQLAAFVLLVALCSPILIKTHHFLFPNHQHCSHCSASASLQHKCEIQDFDYFFFIAEKTVILENCEQIITKEERASYSSPEQQCCFGNYHLRAPPTL